MSELSVTMTYLDGTCPAAPDAACQAGQVRLSALGRRARGRVVGIALSSVQATDAIDPHELERRLLEMGFVEGARFEVLHEGPVGRDPIALKLDDTRLALRRREAHALIVETDKDSPSA